MHVRIGSGLWGYHEVILLISVFLHKVISDAFYLGGEIYTQHGVKDGPLVDRYSYTFGRRD